MRRDQSAPGGDYRREHNAEMWAREGLPSIRVPTQGPRHCPVSRQAVAEQGVGE